MPEDNEKPNESKRGRSRKRQRGSSSKTDEETNDSDMICGQHGHQVDQDNDQTSAVCCEEINQKLEKLLTLCPLIEYLKTQLVLPKEQNTELKSSLKWATDEVNNLRINQNEMRTELNSRLLSLSIQPLTAFVILSYGKRDSATIVTGHSKARVALERNQIFCNFW